MLLYVALGTCSTTQLYALAPAFQGLGMKIGLWISKVSDPFFLVLDEESGASH